MLAKNIAIAKRLERDKEKHLLFSFKRKPDSHEFALVRHSKIIIFSQVINTSNTKIILTKRI